MGDWLEIIGATLWIVAAMIEMRARRTERLYLRQLMEELSRKANR